MRCERHQKRITRIVLMLYGMIPATRFRPLTHVRYL